MFLDMVLPAHWMRQHGAAPDSVSSSVTGRETSVLAHRADENRGVADALKGTGINMKTKPFLSPMVVGSLLRLPLRVPTSWWSCGMWFPLLEGDWAC